MQLAEEQVVGADRLVADQADLVVFITVRARAVINTSPRGTMPACAMPCIPAPSCSSPCMGPRGQGVPNNSKYNNAFLLPDTRTPYANGRPHWRGTGNLGIPIHLYYSKNYKWCAPRRATY